MYISNKYVENYFELRAEVFYDIFLCFIIVHLTLFSYMLRAKELILNSMGLIVFPKSATIQQQQTKRP